MDQTHTYRIALKQVLEQYAQHHPTPNNGAIRTDLICDPERDCYALMSVGWNEHRRIFAPIFYAMLRHGQIILEHDGLGYGISADLVAAGVAPTDIIWAWEQSDPPVSYATYLSEQAVIV
ncbi:MAG: XisI protein [Chloroflexaceae bacterium]|nr:XisI protein [Chloroflexaceae bacterium]